MNEILKKRIEEAAGKSSFKYLSQDGIEELELGCHYEAGFMEGAQYALSHQWISVDEALPECSVIVFVKDKYDNYDIAYLSKKGYWIANDGRKIIVSLWMPIPKFETKDKEEML